MECCLGGVVSDDAAGKFVSALGNGGKLEEGGVKSFRLWVYSRLTSWLPESRGYGLKNALLRWAGARIGKNVRIYSSARIMGVGDLVIGDDVHVGPDVLLYPNPGGAITIGSHVDIGPRVTIVTGSHEIDPSGDHIGGKGTAAPVVIGSGSWLCACSTILPGVNLPEKTLVAAGAVVAKSVEAPCSLLAGMPARVKRSM